MRWPWRRPRPPLPVAASDDADEACRARLQAEEDLRRTHEQTAEVRELAEKLRRHQRVNHFAELFGRSIEGGPH
jgi:transcription elongation GreA/GreB family factor